MQRDLTVADFARQQGGHVTRNQFADAGFASSTLRRRVQRGQLVRVGRQTFRLASVARTERGDVVAACLDTTGAGSHWTASGLHGLTALPRLIDVTVSRFVAGSQPRRVGREQPRVRVHTSTNLPAEDVISVQGIPVTTVARTLLGLAALVPSELAARGLATIVGRAVDEGLASDPWLWHHLERRRCRGRNGVLALEDVLARRAGLGPTESWLEREVLRLLAVAGLPMPVTQRVMRSAGRFVARVDLVYEEERLVLEALGYAHHRTAADLEADTRRANELQLLGYDVLQFAASQVVNAPESVVETVRRALAGHDGVRSIKGLGQQATSDALSPPFEGAQFL